MLQLCFLDGTAFYNMSLSWAWRVMAKMKKKGLLRFYPNFEWQLWFYPHFVRQCIFTPTLLKQSFSLPLLREEPVTVLKMLTKDRFTLESLPLLLVEHCDFTPIWLHVFIYYSTHIDWNLQNNIWCISTMKNSTLPTWKKNDSITRQKVGSNHMHIQIDNIPSYMSNKSNRQYTYFTVPHPTKATSIAILHVH
jgi:hypothetical protein